MHASGAERAELPWRAPTHPKLEHRPVQLVPGMNLEASLEGEGEHHLHAFLVESRSSCTLILHAPEHLALWLLEGHLENVAGPSMLIQRVLEPGAYWAHVGKLGEGGRGTCGYRLRLHCVPL